MKHIHRDPAEGGSWDCPGCRAARDAEFKALEEAEAARKAAPQPPKDYVGDPTSLYNRALRGED